MGVAQNYMAFCFVLMLAKTFHVVILYAIT